MKGQLLRAAFLLLTAAATAAAAPRKPNILVILGDDHAPFALGAYGNRLARTPNLDRLAAAGVRFERAYTNSPVCTPSRQCLLTGKLPHAVGVTQLQTALAADQWTVAEHLRRFGYRTGAIGKMHFNSEERHGFDDRIDLPDYRRWVKEHPTRPPAAGVRVKPEGFRPFVDPARVWLNAACLPAGRYDEDMAGTFLARKAVEFLEENRDRSFCLWVSFYEPHSPFDFPIEFAGRFDPASMPVPQVRPEDDPQIPRVFRDLTPAEKQGIAAAYYTSAAFLDQNVGRVLDALRSLGLSEDTLIVYAGDNGYSLGQHGRFEKHSFFEPAVRVPLLMSFPGRFPRGAKVDGLVEFVDVVPTLLESCGVEQPANLEGRSLVPLLTGKTRRGRDYVFSEYLFGWAEAMVRTDRWKLVYVKGDRDRTDGYETEHPRPGKMWRLYDVRNDPDETTNLAASPEHRATASDLRLKMLERLKRGNPAARDLPPGLPVEQAIDYLLRAPEEIGRKP